VHGVVHHAPGDSRPVEDESHGQLSREWTDDSFERPFGRYFEEFEVGDVISMARQDDHRADDHLFCMITMNHHPLQTNAWFAEHETSTTRTCRGNLVYSLVLGMSVPTSPSGDRESRGRDADPSQPDLSRDTIYAETRVLERPLSKSRMIGDRHGRNQGFNQDGLEVATSDAKVMVWSESSPRKRQRPYSATSGVTTHRVSTSATSKRARTRARPAVDRH